MRSLPSAMMLLLLLRIAYGSAEDADENPSSGTISIAPEECKEEEQCLRRLCSMLIRFCGGETHCDPRIADCFRLLSESPEGLHEKRIYKRGSISKNSYLLMKLHPVLNRAADGNLMDLPARYRRIGVRLGSEFLGKRSGRRAMKSMTATRFSGTELLGKRFGSEMLGKREVEFLGKRGNEFLGKRSRTRMRGCQIGDSDCFIRRFPSNSNIFTQYIKATGGSEVDHLEREFYGMNNFSNRFRPARFIHPVYSFEKLQMS